MKLISVKILDTFSIEKLSLNLPDKGLVLLSGWNKDLNRSNGAGKSSLLLSICWAIYGALPRNISVDELIRRGKQECAVEVVFTVNNQTFKIVRKRPSALFLSIDGVVQKGGAKTLQAIIEMSIGLNYDQFLLTTFFPQKGDSSRFLNQKDSDAKEFLASILNFNKVDTGYKKLHLELKDKEYELATGNRVLTALTDSLSKFDSLLAAELPSPPDANAVREVKEKINAISVKLSEPEVVNPNTQVLQNKVDALHKAKMKVAQLEGEVARSLAAKNRIAEAKSSHLSCPSCDEELFMSSGELCVFDDESFAADKEARLSKLDGEIVALRETISKASSYLNQLPELEAQLLESKTDDIYNKRGRTSLESELRALRQTLSSFKFMYENYTSMKNQKESAETHRSNTAAEIETETTKITSIESEIRILAAAKQVLSPTGAIAYALDSIIEDINASVGQYLDIFSGNTLTYKLTSGEERAKLSHTVYSEGTQVSLGSLSGGEERGLIISVDLGISDVICSRAQTTLPSILLLDEAFEGLDYVGKENVIDALKEVAENRCIIIIDHSTEMCALFSASFHMTKENGISKLEVL